MRASLLVLAAVTLTACSDTEPTSVSDVDPLPVTASARGSNDALTVATRNLYLGGDIDRILNAPAPEAIPLLAMETWMEIQTSRFPERARAMAREFATNPPHVIGLQEAPLFRIQAPGDAHLGNPVAATDVAMDFLEILMAAFAAEGLEYRVATMIENADVELPMVVGPPTEPGGPPALADIRFTDRDAILVRADVDLKATDAANFTAIVGFAVAGAIPIELKRGWTKVTFEFGKKEYHLVNAHLEIQRFAPVQEAQMAELLGLLADVVEPVFLVGDLNSDADGSQTASYAMARDAGFLDSWDTRKNREPGQTCCYHKDLTGGLDKMTERIDFVLYRDPDHKSGKSKKGKHKIAGKVEAELLGAGADDLTESGLWPSDHRGLRVTARLPQKSVRHKKK